MPRDRRGQAPQAENAQTYGVRNDQLEAQRQMPLPVAPGLPSASGGSPAAPVQPVPPPDPMQSLVQDATQFQPPSPLVGPSTRPTEPVTAGMMVGAGPGREALSGMFSQRPDFTADVIRRAAIATGNPRLASMYDKLQMLRGKRGR